jgi:hypothetical protein
MKSASSGRRVIAHAFSASERCLEALGVVSPQVLLLLGHMRSGSTLLLHLLLTNREVAALGERNAVYASPADFARLAITTRVARRALFARLGYVADQVNHDRFTPDSALLAQPRVRVVFVLRRPQGSLVSLLELSRRFYGSSWSVAQAVDYYIRRLETLMKQAQSFPAAGDAALVRYESLTASPERTLEALRQYLGLRHGFSTTYSAHSFTGVRGDPGPNIGAGRIVRTESATSDQLSAADRSAAESAYEQCVGALAQFALDDVAADLPGCAAG